jgi:hypothetical protein
MLLIISLIENHQKIERKILQMDYNIDTKTTYFAYRVLTFKPFIKFPLLLILCFPLIFLATAILLLFGQQPDSIVSAFTDTYKHGFSQLDYICDNVSCGGHYLCSVAANGNKKIVKPKRLGIRNNGIIICNRQLLLSNAFEELLEKYIPKIHKHIRCNYDKVGDSIHNNYKAYEKKWVSNIIYFLMKPFELFFWITLYSFERNPENKISLQYVDKTKKKMILKQL